MSLTLASHKVSWRFLLRLVKLWDHYDRYCSPQRVGVAWFIKKSNWKVVIFLVRLSVLWECDGDMPGHVNVDVSHHLLCTDYVCFSLLPASLCFYISQTDWRLQSRLNEKGWFSINTTWKKQLFNHSINTVSCIFR